MVREPDRNKTVPPYVSYKTFREFVTSLPLGVQEQIDRVVWDSRLGDKTSAQLLAALRFLGLVSLANEPTEVLFDLAIGSIEERIKTLGSMLEKRYAPVIDALASGSRDAFEEAFCVAFGTTGDTTRKSIGFFLHAAIDARLSISKDIIKGRQPGLSLTRQWPPLPREWTPSPMQSEPRAMAAALSVAPEEGRNIERMDPALRGILLSLPEPGPLAGEVKDAWKKALEAVFDLVYPTGDLNFSAR